MNGGVISGAGRRQHHSCGTFNVELSVAFSFVSAVGESCRLRVQLISGYWLDVYGLKSMHVGYATMHQSDYHLLARDNGRRL